MSLVRSYPLSAFFVLPAHSRGGLGLYLFGLLPNPIVGFGPFLAALVVLAVTEGKSDMMGLLRGWCAGAWESSGMPWRSCFLSWSPLMRQRSTFLAGRSAHRLSGRFGWLVELLTAVFAVALDPWPRWHLGGARVQGVRPATAAVPVLGTS